MMPVPSSWNDITQSKKLREYIEVFHKMIHLITSHSVFVVIFLQAHQTNSHTTSKMETEI